MQALIWHAYAVPALRVCLGEAMFVLRTRSKCMHCVTCVGLERIIAA